MTVGPSLRRARSFHEQRLLVALPNFSPPPSLENQQSNDMTTVLLPQQIMPHVSTPADPRGINGGQASSSAPVALQLGTRGAGHVLDAAAGNGHGAEERGRSSPSLDSSDDDIQLHRRESVATKEGGELLPTTDHAASSSTSPEAPTHTTIHFLHHRPMRFVPGLVSDPSQFSPLIVGSCPELGSWDPTQSNLWMKPLKGHPEVWYASVTVKNGDGLSQDRPHEVDWRRRMEEEASKRIEPGKMATYRKAQKQLLKLQGKSAAEANGKGKKDTEERKHAICVKCRRLLDASASDSDTSSITSISSLDSASTSSTTSSDAASSSSSNQQITTTHPDLPPLLTLFQPSDLHKLQHTSRIEYKYVLRSSDPSASPGKISGPTIRWEDGPNRVVQWTTCPCHFGGDDKENGTMGVEESWLPQLTGINNNESHHGFLIDNATRRQKIKKENSWADLQWNEEMVRRLVLDDNTVGESSGDGGDETKDVQATVWVVEEGLGIHRDSRRVVVGRAPVAVAVAGASGR